MAPRTAQQQQDKNDDEQAQSKIEAALMGQDIKYMRKDLAEIKGELHDLKSFYETKKEHADDMARVYSEIQDIKTKHQASEESKKYWTRTTISAIIAAAASIIISALVALRAHS